jgi:hypothetical protein
VPAVSSETEEKSIVPILATSFAIPAGILAVILLIRRKKADGICQKSPKK